MTKEYHVLNLGAGVQSTAMALMSMQQAVPDHFPRFDCAIFADTQEEPAEIYSHLMWLKEQLAPSFPVHIRSAGKLGDDLMHGNAPGGASYDIPGKQRFASIPAFTLAPDGSVGMTRRQCTKEYKTDVVERYIRRELLGLEPKQRVPKGVIIHQYVGLSYDEPKRIFGRNGRPGAKARIEANRWARAHFPLYDLFLTRAMLRGWLAKQEIPHRVPRSACTICPYHDNEEWGRLKKMPAEWARILEVDDALRQGAFFAGGLAGELYLHRSCVPMRDVDLSQPDPRPAQQDLNFSALECEGMCGL